MSRVLVADDHEIVRKGIIQILREEFPRMTITEASDGTELIKKARSAKFDIIISDISMPGRSGLEALKQLKEEFPKIPVLILSMHSEDQFAIRVLKAGASAYLTKETASDELVKAVQILLSGKKYITPAVALKLSEIIDKDISKKPHELLSDREFEVMKLIAAGKTVSAIAKKLSISGSTVGTYRSRIFSKINMKTNAELIHYVIENNLL
ncbi:MAG: response regulator transcription factor [Bacteroidota bacterium]